MEKKVSIIVPVYNAEDTIVNCVNSIRNQTYKNIEIICVNDGAKDRSLKILQTLSEKDERIVVIDKQNGGVSSARNAGLRSATGEYVQFVDSDDAIKTNMVEILVDSLENSGAQWAICGYEFSDGQGLRVPENVCYTVEKFLENFCSFYAEGFFCSPWNKLFVKQFIKHTFNEDMNLGEDAVFNAEYMLGISKICMVKEALYLYTAGNTESLSFRYNPKAFYCETKKNAILFRILESQNLVEQQNLLRNECVKDFVRCINSEIFYGNYKKNEMEQRIYEQIQEKFWKEIFMKRQCGGCVDDSRVKRNIRCHVTKISLLRKVTKAKKILKRLISCDE